MSDDVRLLEWFSDVDDGEFKLYWYTANDIAELFHWSEDRVQQGLDQLLREGRLIHEPPHYAMPEEHTRYELTDAARVGDKLAESRDPIAGGVTVDYEQLGRFFGWPPERIHAAVDALEQSGELREAADRADIVTCAPAAPPMP